MANLNFTRSIGGNASLARSSVGFGANSMSGHVTPVFGQQRPTTTTERRTLPSMGNTNQIGGSMNTLGGYSSFNNVFGTGDGTNTPSLLDLSEFPSLTNNRNSASGDVVSQQQQQQQQHLQQQQQQQLQSSSSSIINPMAGIKPYVGMVKQPTSESSEFTMINEDFPALPGTQNRVDGCGGVGGVSSSSPMMENEKSSSSVHQDTDLINHDLLTQQQQQQLITTTATSTTLTTQSSLNDKNNITSKLLLSGGIRSTPDGRVSNIPANMVSDQFGVVGLLAFIRAAESDPNLVSLALGQDLTALGLNLNSPENLYPSFGGPWADHPCRPQDVDFHVPPEYLINHAIRNKLAPMKWAQYKDDVLFFIFYTSVGDVLQIAAATELYNREWRYHIEEKVWITQVPGMVLLEKTNSYERGTYYFFDVQSWRKVAKEFHLDYSKLEGQPGLNST